MFNLKKLLIFETEIAYELHTKLHTICQRSKNFQTPRSILQKAI